MVALTLGMVDLDDTNDSLNTVVSALDATHKRLLCRRIRLTQYIQSEF